jgi:poly-beta-1,6-N-acetyl-D-glucosamine synthase
VLLSEPPPQLTGARLPSYAVISPVKDEAAHLARTLESMVAQSHRPVRWVLVDDSSRDETAAIASRYAERHDWIRVVASEDRSGRARGGKIVRAFNTGLAALHDIPDFLVKLDGDLFLPAHYFAWVAETFARVPDAGILGGVTRVFDGRRWTPDATSHHNLSGVAKAYRRECFRDIGGLRASMGWDGIDEYAARARGWQVYVLSELPILHYERRGSKQRWYRARWEEGAGAHYMGYRTDFMLVRTLYRMLREPPPLLGGLVFACAFALARLGRAPSLDDPLARELLRLEQGVRLKNLLRLRGADVAVPELPAGGPAFWSIARDAARSSREVGARA